MANRYHRPQATSQSSPLLFNRQQFIASVRAPRPALLQMLPGVKSQPARLHEARSPHPSGHTEGRGTARARGIQRRPPVPRPRASSTDGSLRRITNQVRRLPSSASADVSAWVRSYCMLWPRFHSYLDSRRSITRIVSGPVVSLHILPQARSNLAVAIHHHPADCNDSVLDFPGPR